MTIILYENFVSVGRARPTISPHVPPGGWEVHGAKFNIHLTVPLQKQSQLRQKLQWSIMFCLSVLVRLGPSNSLSALVSSQWLA